MSKREWLLFWFVFGCVCLGYQAFAQDVTIHRWTPQTRLEPVTQLTGFRSQDNVDRIWRRSPIAAHHDAVCRVMWSGGAGTGVCIQHDGEGAFVLTNQHVVSVAWRGNGFDPRTVATATVTTHGGQSWTGAVVYSNQSYDIAVLYCRDAKPKTSVPIAAAMPPVGTELEMCGIGGPTDGMRHFVGKRLGTNSAVIQIDACCVSGDSGGPILWNGSLVGINFGARGRAVSDGRKVEGWSLKYPASSDIGPEQLQTVLTQVCQPYRCQPIIRGRGQVVLPAPAPVQGSPGPPGPPGPQGPPGQDAQVTPEQLGAIAAAITEQLRNDPSLRGPQGPAGQVSQDDLAYAVEQYFLTHPNTITLSLVDESGTVLDSDTVELGGELKLQFVERAK